ncbi:MAG: hypothetical protein IT369_12160, partial [Candidatus Latescibacteria bacterium]|nr:hypothetical protein [Candidatus Latescibacterota bacterium]
TLGGLIQAQGEFMDAGDSRFTKDNRFLLRRARLNAQGSFAEGFDFRVEVELGGTSTALRGQMTDGYGLWNRHPGLTIRAGQFKTPFGYEQLMGDPVLFTIERSLANDRLTLSRQVGVQVSGSQWQKRLSYAVGLFNGNGVNNGANDGEDFLYVARLTGIPAQGKMGGREFKWSAGAGAYSSKDGGVTLSGLGFDSDATGAKDNILIGKRHGLGLDTQVHLGAFDLWVEYLNGTFEADNQVPADKLTAAGSYAQLAYFVRPSKLQAVLKYEIFDPNTDKDKDDTTTLLLGVNEYLKGDDLKLQLDFQRSDAPGLSDGENKILTRLQVIF